MEKIRSSFTHLAIMMLMISMLLAGCNEQIGDYIAASSISKNGFAINGDEIRAVQGQEIRLWGFVDHGNLYGDDGARKLLAEWWSGVGPSTTAWRFNLKANAEDETGRSFPVHVPYDPGWEALLEAFAADARAHRPTRVFLQGRLFSFDAPSQSGTLTGLSMQLQSSQDIRVGFPAKNREP